MKKILIALVLLAGCATTDTEQTPVQGARTGVGPTQPDSPLGGSVWTFALFDQ